VFHDVPPSLKYDEGDGQSSGARTHRHIPLELVHLRTEHQVNGFVGCDYNIIPYQRRALNAGKCGVEVEGGRVPTSDWMLNLQILTSGGFH